MALEVPPRSASGLLRPVLTWRLIREGWPLGLLLLLDTLGLACLAQGGDLPITAISMSVSTVVLIFGLLPALLRPGTVSTIVGCFTVALAALLALMPAPTEIWVLSSRVMPRWPVIGTEALRLANGVLLGPLALHLAVARAPRSPLPSWAMGAMYTVVLLALLTILSVAPGGVRMLAQTTLGIGFLATIGATVWLLVRASQTPLEPELRLAPEARLVLSSLLLAELPLLLTPPLALAGIVLPFALVLGAQVILPLGIAAAILRHDLLEIDPAVRRALTYGALSLLLLVIYLGLTSAFTFVLGRLGPPLQSVAALGGLLIAAIAFTPMHRVSSAAIERVLYPERCIFELGIQAAHASLSQVVGREAVERLLVEELPRRLGVAWAALDLPPTPAGPPRPATAWQAPLRVGGRTLGHYRLGMRTTGLPFGADERAQLDALLRQAALALAYAEMVEALSTLNRELEERVESRTAQVLAQQRELITMEERQRLARDLHDSVKQTLFSLGLGVRAARGQIRTDPALAQESLREQEQAVFQAQVEMGALLAQLRAPPHGPIDLARALAEHCAGLERSHALAVSLELPPALRLPERPASELLRIAREALHNVIKHSGHGAARLRLAVEGAAIVVEVSDGGRGFDPAAAPGGMGLRGMGERAAALGGSLELRSAPGRGATVIARIPAAPEDEHHA